MTPSKTLSDPPTTVPRRHDTEPSAYHWAALPVLLSGTFLVVLDFFIVNVALPSTQTGLHAGATALEWVVAGYGLTFAVLLIAAGQLGDRWGRRRLFLLGIALFTLASAACGAAPNVGALVTARLFQGAAAALITPIVLAIIGVMFSGKQRTRAIGAYATTMGVAAAGGQLIGGVLLTADVAGLGWRSVFLINIPVGVAALALIPRLVPESRSAHSTRLDVSGLVLATAGLTALILPLLEGRQQGWPAWTWLSLAAAPFLIAAFVLRQRSMLAQARTPLLDLRLFGSRAFSVGMLGQFLLFCGQASYFVILALYLQQGRGLSAMDSGLMFTIVAVSYLYASAKAAGLAARFGRGVVIAGAVLLAGGHLALLLTTRAVGIGGPVLAVSPGLLLAGAGMGLCITALTVIVLQSANAEQAGAISGTLSTAQQVGNAVGVAIIGPIFFGALPAGYDHAFELGLEGLVCMIGALVVLTLALPARRAASREGGLSEAPSP
ncbi:MAG TPA: MFS transporter [Mycobacteriales bacterium]|jgi:EmrB/QacA subfamily drug resistance transporter|nr:MFS transporter [Mycobacteriales bacterium]